MMSSGAWEMEILKKGCMTCLRSAASIDRSTSNIIPYLNLKCIVFYAWSLSF